MRKNLLSIMIYILLVGFIIIIAKDCLAVGRNHKMGTIYRGGRIHGETWFSDVVSW